MMFCASLYSSKSPPPTFPPTLNLYRLRATIRQEVFNVNCPNHSSITTTTVSEEAAVKKRYNSLMLVSSSDFRRFFSLSSLTYLPTAFSGFADASLSWVVKQSLAASQLLMMAMGVIPDRTVKTGPCLSAMSPKVLARICFWLLRMGMWPIIGRAPAATGGNNSRVATRAEQMSGNQLYRISIGEISALPLPRRSKMVFGAVSDEMEVKAPAAEAWKVYSTLQLAKLVVETRPDLVEKFEVIEGDGGVGTILKLSFPASTPVFTYSKEKFTVVDNKKRVKEVEVIEGGYMNLGFTLFRVRFEIIEKDESTCVTKTTIEYEVKEESAANASFVSTQTFVEIMNAVATYLTTK
nr:S-norcoclaurine synthase 2-like [Ipomoea batatas]